MQDVKIKVIQGDVDEVEQELQANFSPFNNIISLTQSQSTIHTGGRDSNEEYYYKTIVTVIVLYK